jgi:glycosyltransferase involved in cell wall biosynthesis
MDNEEKHYGRRRVKKSRLVPGQVSEQQNAETGPTPVVPEAESTKPEPQTSLEIPLSDSVYKQLDPRPELVPEIAKPSEPEPKQQEAAIQKPEAPEKVQSAREEAKGEKAPIVEKTPIERKQPPRDRFRQPERRPDRGQHERPQRPEKERERPREREQPQRKFSPPPERHKTRVSIIIPAFNEEGNIKALLDQFQEVIVKAGNDWEVIVVDDGSTDKTAERARDAAIRFHWLKVISYPHNRGLTAALETGFQQARGSIFVFYPADLQYHPQDIPKMINRIDRGADIVTGWKQGSYNKRLVSYIYNKLCRMLFKLKVHDLNSVKAFKKEVLDRVILRRDWHRFMVVLAAEAGCVVDEVKVNVYPRYSGKSKFGTGRILGGVLDLLSVKFQISFTKKPLRFFGGWAFVSMLLGIILGLIAVYMRFFTTHGSRTLLYLVILFILSGIMLFSLGFLAEVIVALREEVESLKTKK